MKKTPNLTASLLDDGTMDTLLGVYANGELVAEYRYNSEEVDRDEYGAIAPDQWYELQMDAIDLYYESLDNPKG